MPSIGESLLIAVSALVLHLGSFTSIVADSRVLPAQRLEVFWRESGQLPETRALRLGNAVVAVLFAVLATFVIGSMLATGGNAGLLGGAELVLAAGWLVYLLVGIRERRP